MRCIRPTLGSRQLVPRFNYRRVLSQTQFEGTRHASSAATGMSWRAIADEAQAGLLRSIPDRWRLDVDAYSALKDVTGVPRTCGILTDDQLAITELTAAEIVRRIEAREFKAVQVLEAFAARTAIAHQLVSWSDPGKFLPGNGRTLTELMAGQLPDRLVLRGRSPARKRARRGACRGRRVAGAAARRPHRSEGMKVAGLFST